MKWQTPKFHNTSKPNQKLWPNMYLQVPLEMLTKTMVLLWLLLLLLCLDGHSTHTAI